MLLSSGLFIGGVFLTLLLIVVVIVLILR
jgi:hypothetical protein